MRYVLAFLLFSNALFSINDFEYNEILYCARSSCVNFCSRFFSSSSVAELAANLESLQERAMRWSKKDARKNSHNLSGRSIVPDHKNFHKNLRPDFSVQESAERDGNLHQVVKREREAGQKKMGQIHENFCGRVLGGGKYLVSEISYGGMTIHCDLGCGESCHPDFVEIMDIFAKCINKVFRNCDAIEDYLISDFENTDPKYKITLSQIPLLSSGIAVGIAESAGQAALEFIPDTLNTLRGMGNGLWAFSTDPIGASKAFADAAIQCIEYINKNSVLHLVQDIVPELKELVQNYDQLSDFQKGKLIGQIIGKYGTDILICTYSIKAIKVYRDLKRANQLMTLEALASPLEAKNILEGSARRIHLNEQLLAKETADLRGNSLNTLWHKGTFQNNSESIIYHLKKHGKGRSAVQYTKDAMAFFEEHKQLGTKVILRDGSPGIKIQVQTFTKKGLPLQKTGGYWTEDGKLVTYWD